MNFEATGVSDEVEYFVYELREDMPDCFLTPVSFAQIRRAVFSKTHSIKTDAYSKIESYTKNIFCRDDISAFKPYCGKDKNTFIKHAQISFNSMLYLAFVGAVESNKGYLSVSKHILLSWSMALPAPGTQIQDSHSLKRLTATGLTISRFIDRIIETYRILASYLTNTETFFVKNWLIELGATIKLSHQFWLETFQMEGPSNHLSWHIFGMLSK